MFEFEVYNKKTGEYDVIFGYNREDAWHRTTRLNRAEWVIISSEYID